MQLTRIARGIFSLAAVIPFISTLIINSALTKNDRCYVCNLLIVFGGIMVFVVGGLVLGGYIGFIQKKAPLKEKFNNICLIRKNPIIFVLVYLLPIISNHSLSCSQNIFFVVILFACIFVVHTVAVSPVINVLGYRAYKITNNSNCEFVLLSKRDINSLVDEIEFLKIDPFTLIEKEK